MAFSGDMLWWLILLPALGAALSLLMPSVRAALLTVAVGVPLTAVVAGWAVFTVFRGGPLLSRGEWLHLDALSAYHMVVMAVVFVLSSLYAIP